MIALSLYDPELILLLSSMTQIEEDCRSIKRYTSAPRMNRAAGVKLLSVFGWVSLYDCPNRSGKHIVFRLDALTYEL